MLFRQVAMHHRLPFEGEPLEGLQIMGILETRNLDFRHVIVCSMNEDIFPPSKTMNSFIPYSLRRAYGLPTFDHQDALYAYLFYRMIQRSEHVFLIYNTETTHGQSGEMSRYIQQLQKESGLVVLYFEAEDPEMSLREVGKTDVSRRWEAAMEEFFAPGSEGTNNDRGEWLEKYFDLD